MAVWASFSVGGGAPYIPQLIVLLDWVCLVPAEVEASNGVRAYSDLVFG